MAWDEKGVQNEITTHINEPEKMKSKQVHYTYLGGKTNIWNFN